MFVHSIMCQRIECDWKYEDICGDKCIPYERKCSCGNESLTHSETGDFLCCIQGSCFRDFTGNVECQDGKKHDWRTPCNEKCMQIAKNGHTTISCSNQSQCVKAVDLCQGIPRCNE